MLATVRTAGWILVILIPAGVASAQDSPETKAILKGFTTDLKSKKSEDRHKAAQAIGELGPKGKSACRPLCEAMLDGNVKVRTAAADSLKKVDKDLAELAVAMFVNYSMDAVAKTGALGAAGEPLCPLVWMLASRISNGGTPYKTVTAQAHLNACLEVLAKIAPNDPSANAMILSALSLSKSAVFSDAHCAVVREKAAVLVRSMKHKKQALKPLLFAAVGDTEPIRIAAIESLTGIHDADNGAIIVKTLEDMRFDPSIPVRKAAESALEAIKKK